MIWQGRHHRWGFPRPALLMGVVNVTPDSFFDGGRHFDTASAIAHGAALAAEGAEILDVGGESTRPGARPVEEEEERRRVLPVIEALARRQDVAVSVDTRKPGVARAALAAGAMIVNDVGANREDPALWQVVAETGAAYVCMHMRGNPETMQSEPAYRDVVAEVHGFFAERLERLTAAGVRPDQVALDVGIGFGKTVDHNLALLAALESFRSFQRPLVLGVSRKSFIGKLLGVEVQDRLPASVACAAWAVAHGVEVIRTHDVAATRQAVRLIEALRTRPDAGC
ncbi:MAG: dihydropteroate synthase [Verrucomicrobia bacterium]|nr:dihydropteroate synthase [Verrucomicrobiota bacterium]